MAKNGVTVGDTTNALVKRGSGSWTYIYTVLGFVVTIESTVIGMLTPLTFPWNLAAFLILAAGTTWWFLKSGWFQDKLIGLKTQYEDKAR